VWLGWWFLVLMDLNEDLLGDTGLRHFFRERGEVFHVWGIQEVSLVQVVGAMMVWPVNSTLSLTLSLVMMSDGVLRLNWYHSLQKFVLFLWVAIQSRMVWSTMVILILASSCFIVLSSSPTPGRPTSTFKVTVPGLQTPSYPSMVWTLVLGASLRCPGLAPTPSLVRGGPITSSGMLGSYNGWRGLSIWTRLEGSFPFLQVSQLLV